MSEARHLAIQVSRILEGDPWYGDPILTILDDVSAKDAAAHPIANAHSIWELVLHLTTWVREVHRRLESGVWREPEDGDWPAVPAITEPNWKKSIASLTSAHEALAATIAKLSADQLDQQVGTERNRALGTGVTLQETIHGIIQHDAYHLGQISLLKKSLRQR